MELKKVLDDRDEIPPLAAWAIYKAGDKTFAEQWMLDTITNVPGNKMLANILDWMDEDKIPQLLKDVVDRSEARKKGI